MIVVSLIGALFSFLFFILGKLAFIWAPILLMYMGFELWHHFVTERFILGMTWSLLEIEIPREVEKSPMAMELIFTNSMYHASAKDLWSVWFVGAPHFWFSLEIVGIEGSVKFYIRTPSRIRDLVETQVYAQYPQAKVRDAEDYSMRVSFDAPDAEWHVWGTEFKLLEHDARPIRTYVDYGLDKPSDKELLKIDPLTPTIEFLGSLRRGQQVWIQHIVRPSLKAYHSHATGGHIGWVQESNEEMGRMLAPYTQEFFLKAGAQEGATGVQIRPPDAVANRVKKMQEKIQKLGFDIGIRVMVVAEKKYVSLEEFRDVRLASRLLFRQFNNPDGNSIVRVNSTGFGPTYADPTGLVLHKIQNRMLNWYRHRVFFHPPFWYSMKYPKIIETFFPSRKPEIGVLNVEELATLFHFPGQVSQAPSFRRIDSKVAKPPSNLPI
jgi:hypothetical protein